MLEVLNCRLGDLKLSFDKDKPEEVAKAREAIQKMMRSGFVIFVEVDGKTKRVKRFDPKYDHYIIEDEDATSSTNPKPKRTRTRRIPASKHRATGIAPRAGG